MWPLWTTFHWFAMTLRTRELKQCQQNAWSPESSPLTAEVKCYTVLSTVWIYQTKIIIKPLNMSSLIFVSLLRGKQLFQKILISWQSIRSPVRSTDRHTCTFVFRLLSFWQSLRCLRQMAFLDTNEPRWRTHGRNATEKVVMVRVWCPE